MGLLSSKLEMYPIRVLPGRSLPLFRCNILIIAFFLVAWYTGTSYAHSHKSSSLEIHEHSNVTAPLLLATWNLNQLSDGDTIRIRQVADKIREIEVDLISLQEIKDKSAFNRLRHLLKSHGYKGFIAHYIPYNLRLAYLYRSTRIDSIFARPMPGTDTGNLWVQRRPFVFTFSVGNNTQNPITITTFNIHAKADIPDRLKAYQQRMSAAENLYQYVSLNHHDESLVILGDFNDDMDQSIFQSRLTPYYLFREDYIQFQIATINLSKKNRATTLDHRQPIDHIILSDELSNSVPVNSDLHAPLSSSGDSQVDTLSDHFMVSSKLILDHTSTYRKTPHRESIKSAFPVLCSPNPLNTDTKFTFILNQPRIVTLTIYNLLGRPVRYLIRQQHMGAGRHTVSWHPVSSLPAGLYNYRFTTHSGERVAGRLTLVR